MHDLMTFILLGLAACGVSFAAGITYRNRRQENVEIVIEAAICGLDERLAKIERLHEVSTDLG